MIDNKKSGVFAKLVKFIFLMALVVLVIMMYYPAGVGG